MKPHSIKTLSFCISLLAMVCAVSVLVWAWWPVMPASTDSLDLEITLPQVSTITPTRNLDDACWQLSLRGEVVDFVDPAEMPEVDPRFDLPLDSRSPSREGQEDLQLLGIVVEDRKTVAIISHQHQIAIGASGQTLSFADAHAVLIDIRETSVVLELDGSSFILSLDEPS